MIRDATLEDIDDLIALGEAMRAESLEPYPPIDREIARAYVAAAVQRPATFLLALAETDRPIGMITAVAGPYCFSPVLRAASDLLFVLPEYRGGMTAMKLIARFQEWTADIGAVSATMSVATGVHPERTGKLFQRMGFRPMEFLYRYDVHGR